MPVSQHDTLSEKYPHAAYYDVRMIAAATCTPTRTVQYHCKKCFPAWSGHYRFVAHGNDVGWALSHDSLELLIECLAQHKQRRTFLKK